MYCNFRYLAVIISISYILKLITFRTRYSEQNLRSALRLILHRGQSVEPENNCQSNRWNDHTLLQGDVPEASWKTWGKGTKTLLSGHFALSLRSGNKTGNALHVMWHWGAFVQPLLQCNSSKYYTLRMCVCSLRYPACKARVPHRHLWPVWLYIIFPPNPIQGTVFRGGDI